MCKVKKIGVARDLNGSENRLNWRSNAERAQCSSRRLGSRTTTSQLLELEQNGASVI